MTILRVEVFGVGNHEFRTEIFVLDWGRTRKLRGFDWVCLECAKKRKDFTLG